MAKNHSIKAIVWDLDDTLWHGVISENDQPALRSRMGEILETLDQRGILLSIASKNNHDDAWTWIQSFGFGQYFLYPQINWGPKSESLRLIRERLNIGMDSIAFIDDNPFERDEVKFAHPEVTVFDVDVIEDLLDNPVFMPRFLTNESALRRQMYVQDDERNAAEETFGGNNMEFLRSLEMKFTISRAELSDLQRVEELTVRTNQLNATGYTYSYEELEAFLSSPRHRLFVAELNDRYGSYGKIGVAMLERSEKAWVVKLLLMSCRVMTRGVGSVLLQFLMRFAQNDQLALQAEFRHTDRNRQMFITYKFAGFQEVGKLNQDGLLLEHPLEKIGSFPEYIEVVHP